MLPVFSLGHSTTALNSHVLQSPISGALPIRNIPGYSKQGLSTVYFVTIKSIYENMK